MNKYPKERYGAWAGDPKGHPYDPKRCAQEVWPATMCYGWAPYQCSRRNGYGERGLFCKQHAKEHPEGE